MVDRKYAPTRVWFIQGNHDTDSDHDKRFGASLAHRNLHGRVVEVAGFQVAGLGGAFRESLWAPPLEPAFLSVADRLNVWSARASVGAPACHCITGRRSSPTCTSTCRASAPTFS